MCRFFGVSRSGYYAWRQRKERPDRDAILGALIVKCQEYTKHTYGYRRIKLWLLRETGLLINHKTVLRLMRKYGQLAVIRRRKLPCVGWEAPFISTDNLLARNFHASSPNQKWVTDISYIPTKQGFLYLSVIKDLFDNFIVAYDTGTIQDHALVARTLQKAKKEVTDGLILHSDQGFQYTCQSYLKLSKLYGIQPSMSRPGTPLDNAPAENFFGILKSECINRCQSNSFQQAQQLIDQYIHFYNYERIQLKNGLTPFEKRCQSA